MTGHGLVQDGGAPAEAGCEYKTLVIVLCVVSSTVNDITLSN